jgi:hypothetical protein
MTTPAASLDTAPAAPAKPAALWEDLIDIFTSPSAVFRRRRDGRFWLPLLVYTLLATATFYVGRPVLRPAFERQMSAQVAKITADPNMSAEQKEAIGNRIRGSVDSPFAVLFAAVGVPFVTFLAALGLWLVAKPFGSGATLGQSMAVTALGGIPRATVGLLVAAVSLAMGREAGTMYGTSASPAAFMGPDASLVTAALLSRFDLGVLWHTVLLGIGIALMGRLTRRGGEPVVEGEIPRSKGLTAAAIVWALAGLLTVGQVLNQSAS